MTRRAWTLEGLACVSMLAMAGVPNAHIGQETDRLAADVDVALWALVGRTPEEALQRLNGRPAAAPPRSAPADPADIIAGLRSLARDDEEILCEPLSELRRFLSQAADILELAAAAPRARPLVPFTTEIRA